MLYQKIAYHLIISLLLLLQPAFGDNFIFDLGGVLIDTDPIASLQHIGIKNIAQCMFHLKKSPLTINKHLKNVFFTILNNTALIHSDTTCLPKQQTYDEHGIALPYYMSAWLTGILTSKVIRTTVLAAIEANPEWFTHNAEKQAVINLVQLVFTPEIFITTRKLYHEGIRFIKACKKQGHNVYVLSNWDAQSFQLLKGHYPQLFDLFDGIVISGDTNSAKPSPDIYLTLLERYQLNPTQCWFIDDQPENIAAAQSNGINAILCEHSWPLKKPNFHKIAHHIKTMNSDQKSVTRREKRKNKGIKPKNTKNSSKPIIDGEKIS